MKYIQTIPPHIFPLGNQPLLVPARRKLTGYQRVVKHWCVITLSPVQLVDSVMVQSLLVRHAFALNFLAYFSCARLMLLSSMLQ